MKVFISHSSSDKKFVRTLKYCLSENGIDTFLDEDELNLGDNLLSKLESALDKTSHLVIILSPASVDSEWVKLELIRALENRKTGITQKIIPIIYRKCSIPSEINDLIHHDLSSEVVMPIDGTGRLKFISDGFEPFLLKLVKAINSSSNSFSKFEKEEIIKSIKSTEHELENNLSSVHRGHYEINGFSNSESKLKYQKLISQKDKSLTLNENRPILLPLSLKSKFKIEIGEKIEIIVDNQYKSFGHFAGFRDDDLKLVLSKNTREEVRILPRQLCQVEYYLDKKIIQISRGNSFDPGKFPGFFIN